MVNGHIMRMEIISVLCGEPWDAYGVKHSFRGDLSGDMTLEEAQIFMAGEGCPACRKEDFVLV